MSRNRAVKLPELDGWPWQPPAQACNVLCPQVQQEGRCLYGWLQMTQVVMFVRRVNRLSLCQARRSFV